MVWAGNVFFFQAEDGIRDYKVTGVQTCALPIAKFGFFTRATTTREITNGPLVVITREGVTRISFTPCPLCLSPRVGISNDDLSLPVFLIQTSTLRQQVIIDNDTRSFSAVNLNN